MQLMNLIEFKVLTMIMTMISIIMDLIIVKETPISVKLLMCTTKIE